MLLSNSKANIKVLTFSLLPIALVLFVVAAYFIARNTNTPSPAPLPQAAPNGTPASPAIEERWGIRIAQVGVTADGGLLDFRFLVLDPDKAMAMQQDKATQPFLIDEQTGTQINSSPTMSHKHQLNAGLTYFELYRNPKGVVQPGRLVTVMVGDLRLEHVVAQ